MAITKPTKPSNLMPDAFALSGVKTNFSQAKIDAGYSANFDDIMQGDNLNYMVDSISQQLKYLCTIVDYINSVGVGKVPYVNANNALDVADINTLLPTQTGNSGKYLTTNGALASWSNDFRVIGEPIITLNFNYVLPDNCVWLDGTAGTENDGVVPTTGDWAALFAIYGWQYDTSYTNTAKFKLPNFNNRAIWGGTTAGYIEAGLPNISGSVSCYSGINPNSGSSTSALYSNKKVGNAGSGTPNTGNLYFNASRCNAIYGNSSTVQPPAIKARVYTRYK